MKSTVETKIDTYVDSVYEGFAETEEVLELKEEMRAHLIQSTQDLKGKGYSEEESVHMAIERFGDTDHLKRGLGSLYGAGPGSAEPSSGRNYLAWTGLIAGILSLVWFGLPPVSLVFGIIGLITAVAARRKSTGKMVKWGLILSAAGILLSAILWISHIVH